MDFLQSTSPLLSLPVEIRRHILSYILNPSTASASIERTEQAVHSRDYHEYETSSSVPNEGQSVLRFRNSRVTNAMKLRATYKVRWGLLRSACEDASYACQNAPGSETAVMRACKQLHHEAVELLYTTHTFDFDTHIEACVPFLRDLTPFTRSRIRRLSIVKRALPYEKDFDRCEWSGMCKYLSTELDLWYLSLGVVAGKPALGWDGIRTIKKDEFDLMIGMREELAWVEEVANIKGLRGVHVRACIEHSPPPCSSALAFYVTFSASVEPSFAEYLSGRLVPQVA